MPVPGFETEAALRELLHVPEQRHGALEHTRKIQERVRVQRPLIPSQGGREDSPDTARQDDVQIAAEGPDRVGHSPSNLRRRLTMAFPGFLGVAVHALEARACKGLLARPAV